MKREISIETNDRAQTVDTPRAHKSRSLQAYHRFTGKSRGGRPGARRTWRIRKYKDLIGRLFPPIHRRPISTANTTFIFDAIEFRSFYRLRRSSPVYCRGVHRHREKTRAEKTKLDKWRIHEPFTCSAESYPPSEGLFYTLKIKRAPVCKTLFPVISYSKGKLAPKGNFPPNEVDFSN